MVTVKVTVGNTKDNTVTPFASLANTVFVWRLGDGVTKRKGNGKACYFLI